jgi:hypothetical protein
MSAASAHTAASPWLVRQLCEVAGDVDQSGVPDLLERLALRIECQMRATDAQPGRMPAATERLRRT